ncbi:MAG: hypothetical protein IM607_07820 [Cytophagales bacterium]|nr:hypothetical protein [Cytophagales bacterium]
MEPVEPISAAEQELQDLKEMVSKPYDKDTFLFFLELSYPLPDHFWKNFENLFEDNWPDVWSEFQSSIWRHIQSVFQESFKMGIKYTFKPTKKHILEKFIEAFTTFRDKQSAELLKKCKERYQEFYQKKEIQRMFSLPPEKALNLLKLKETYGQEVFWSQVFSDYKPFDAKDWLEDGESL